MRTVSNTCFLEYCRNAWLSGMYITEILEELIVRQDIEVSEGMAKAVGLLYDIRDDRISREEQPMPTPTYLDNRHFKRMK